MLNNAQFGHFTLLFRKNYNARDGVQLMLLFSDVPVVVALWFS